MTKFTSSLIALSVGLAALQQVQAGVTIYQPVPTDPALLPPSVNQAQVIGVSAIAVASDGVTQYVATEVETANAIGGTTVTFSPTTFVVSFEEGALTYHVSQGTTTTVDGHGIAINADLNCGPGTGGNLNCVQKEQLSFDGTKTSATVTFLATESPIFTITGSTGPLPTAKNGTIRVAPFTVTTSLLHQEIWEIPI